MLVHQLQQLLRLMKVRCVGVHRLRDLPKMIHLPHIVIDLPRSAGYLPIVSL